MLWRLRPSDIDIQLHTYTREMCKWLEKETGEVSWMENGGLFIANNKERFDEYLRLHETGKAFDIESRIVKPNEINDIHPLLRTDDVYSALYSPTDGTIDPTSIVNAYAKAAKKIGATVLEKTSVASIETTENPFTNTKSVKSVTTTNGDVIQTPIVINACGAWARKVTQMVGEDIPLKAMKHAFIVTETIEG